MQENVITMNKALAYTINKLTSQNIKHEVHRFASGCAMIDIWVGSKFYCLQFVEYKVGISRVTEDTAFDSNPDKWFTNQIEFKTQLEKILITA
jgi:hypothetical protein